MRGLILFAHGARDPRWAEPLLRLRDRVAGRAPGTPVSVAFLDIMQPDLPTAGDDLVRAGCTSLGIVPVFLGQGGHVRRDLAALIGTLASRYPDLDIQCAPAVGEDDAVLDALAEYSLAALAGRKAPAT
jgi:sirohydrochlorin cobaltochelatase